MTYDTTTTDLFCLRIDPMIDGTSNSVIETDVVPLEAPTGSDGNWAGNGFVTKKTVLSSTDVGGRLYDAEKGRMWSFVNEDKLHYSSKLPVGFKVRLIFLCSISILIPTRA